MALTKSDKTYIENILNKALNGQESKFENVLIKQESKFENKLDEIEQKFENKLIKFRDDFYTKIDPILKEVVTNRDERTLLSAHSKDHTDRIENLEKIHPQGKHSPATAWPLKETPRKHLQKKPDFLYKAWNSFSKTHVDF